MQDCENLEKHKNPYSSFSCEEAPGGGKECVGQGTGGKYSSCKDCLRDCPIGKDRSSLAMMTKQSMNTDDFFFGSLGGKIIFVLLILVGLLILINLGLYFHRKYYD
jgi:hypothetical protein